MARASETKHEPAPVAADDRSFARRRAARERPLPPRGLQRLSRAARRVAERRRALLAAFPEARDPAGEAAQALAAVLGVVVRRGAGGGHGGAGDAARGR